MKTQREIPGGVKSIAAGTNKKHNSSYSQTISKRSKVMSPNSLIDRMLVSAIGILLALVVIATQSFAQTYHNFGTYNNNSTATFKTFANEVSGSVTNSATGDLRIKVAATNAHDAASFDTEAGKMSYIGANGNGNKDQDILMLIKNNKVATLYASGGGTKTLADATLTSFTVTSKVTSDGASTKVATGGKTLTLTGSGTVVDPQNTGSFDFTTGTVDYNEAAVAGQNIYSPTGSYYATLKVSKNGSTATMQGDVEVQTQLNVANGAILAIDVNKLTLNEATFAGSGTINGGSSAKLEVKGTTGAKVTLPSISTLSDITVDRTNGVDLGGSLTTATATLKSGQLQVGVGQYFKLTDAVTFSGGTFKADNTNATVEYASTSTVGNGQKVIPGSYWNLKLAGTAKKDLTTAPATFTVKGDFTTDPSISYVTTGSTLDFAGSTQSISSDFQYVNFKTSGAGDKTVSGTSGTLSVTGDFDNGGGGAGAGVAAVLNMGGKSFAGLTGTVDNTNAKIQFGGDGTNGKVFTTGTVEYNGASQAIQGHATLDYASLILSGSSGDVKSIAAGVRVGTSGNLDIGAGIELDVNASTTAIAQLVVAGNVTSWGVVKVNANTTSGNHFATLSAYNFNNGDATHTSVSLTVDGTLTVTNDMNNYGSLTNNGTITVGN